MHTIVSSAVSYCHSLLDHNEESTLWDGSLVQGKCSQSFTLCFLLFHKSKHVRKVASEWHLYCLDVVGEVLVLHGEVHGPLQALVAGVHHLPRQPRQRLLDVQVVVRVVQVVVPEPCAGDSKGRTDQGRRRRA